jgi:outer membrane lipopolysaccharide assembly protein LptE/RlpB
MNRTLEWIRLLTIIGLLVACGFQVKTIHTQQAIIELNLKTIDMQGATIEHWKMRAMACEDVVLK